MPQRYAGGQIAAIVRIPTDELAKILESLPAHGHVVVGAAGITHLVPDVVQTIRLLNGSAEFPPVNQLKRLADINVLAITAIKGEQLVDDRALRKAKRIGQRRGSSQFVIPAAEQIQIGNKVLWSSEDIADFARIQNLQLNRQGL